MWFRSPKRPKTLVCTATYQRLKTKANGAGIGLRARRRLCLAQQLLVDVQRLLHTTPLLRLTHTEIGFKRSCPHRA